MKSASSCWVTLAVLRWALITAPICKCIVLPPLDGFIDCLASLLFSFILPVRWAGGNGLAVNFWAVLSTCGKLDDSSAPAACAAKFGVSSLWASL